RAEERQQQPDEAGTKPHSKILHAARCRIGGQNSTRTRHLRRILAAVMMRGVPAWAALFLALVGTSTFAGQVRLPLTVEPPVIRPALIRDLYNDPNQRAVFWGQPGECSFFYLQDPEVAGETGRVRVTSTGEARLGTDLGSTCLSPLAWGGFV